MKRPENYNELSEALQYLKSKKRKSVKDKESINILESVIGQLPIIKETKKISTNRGRDDYEIRF